jgi:hypothetical protein
MDDHGERRKVRKKEEGREMRGRGGGGCYLELRKSGTSGSMDLGWWVSVSRMRR